MTPGLQSGLYQQRTANGGDLDALGGDIAHPAIGLVVLLAVLVLNVYKPRGLTGYGQRKQHERREESAGAVPP